MIRHSSLLLLCYLIFGATTPLSAQDASSAAAAAPASHAPWYLGISAGVFYSMHSGGFAFPSDCAECGRYNEATGIGTAMDLRLSIPLLDWLRFEPRIFGECHRGEFTSDPIETEIIGRDLKPQTLTLEDDLDYTLRTIGLDLIAVFAIGRSGFSVLAGPALGFRVTESAKVTERIVSPDGATFVDGSTDHVMLDGDSEIARGLHAGIRAGAGYTLKLNRDLALGFELSWLLPLQTVGEDNEWKTAGARGLVTLLFVW
jgi:hypothetical protein